MAAGLRLLLTSDFRWLRDSLPSKLQSLPLPDEDLSQWLELAKCSSWKKLVALAVESETAARIASSEQSENDSADDHQGVFCYECGYTCSSMDDLRNHAHRSHGYVCPSRAYCPTNTCLAS